MLTAQRPLVYAATDMVDAIDRAEDIRQSKAELQWPSRGGELSTMLQAHASHFAPSEGGEGGRGRGGGGGGGPTPIARLGSSHLREMDRATRVTNDFLSLTSGGWWEGGVELVEVVSAAPLVAYGPHDLPLHVEFLLPSENTLVRVGERELLLQGETRIELHPSPSPAPSSSAGVEAQLEQASAYLSQLAEVVGLCVSLQVELSADKGGGGEGGEEGRVRQLSFSLGSGEERTACELSCSPQVGYPLLNHSHSSLLNPSLSTPLPLPALQPSFAPFTSSPYVRSSSSPPSLAPLSPLSASPYMPFLPYSPPVASG